MIIIRYTHIFHKGVRERNEPACVLNYFFFYCLTLFFVIDPCTTELLILKVKRVKSRLVGTHNKRAAVDTYQCTLFSQVGHSN